MIVPMVTTLSSKGQVVLPRQARARLRLTPGTKLVCEIHGDTLVLKAQAPARRGRAHVVDPISGLRVSRKSAASGLVTSETVKALLADFP